MLVAAVEAYRTSPSQLEFAGACEDAAAALLRSGAVEEATRMLYEASAFYEGCNAVAAVARVNAGLRALGVRTHQAARRPTQGWESLTPTERQVVALVARGKSNPQIAVSLFISRRTVETHVAHIFRKVQVTNRSELAVAATLNGYAEA